MTATFSPATEPLSPQQKEQLQKTLLPVEQASTLPPEAYTSPHYYELEIENIFTKSWINAGRLEDLPNPGDFTKVDLVGQSIIVVRDSNNDIRAYHNFCRHRGAELVSEKGNAKSFTCPYHGWLYNLEGELRATPQMGEIENFDKANYGLVPVNVETWEGFIMVNLDPGAQPFHTMVSEYTKFGGHHYQMHSLQTVETWEWRVKCNWKAYAEGYIEAYHVPWVHPVTFQENSPLKGWTDHTDISEQPWSIMIGEFPGLSYSNTGEAVFKVVPETENIASEYSGLPIWIVHPSFGILNSVDNLLYFSILPNGPQETIVKVSLCLHPDSAKAIEAGDPQALEYFAEYKENVEVFVAEDNDITEKQSRGYTQRSSLPGRYSAKHESLAWKLDKWIVNTAYLADEHK